MELGKIEKGYLGSLIVEKAFIKNGFNVFKPVMENGKVDMIVEKINVYLKIQIKTIQFDRGSKKIPVRKLTHNKTKHTVTLYTSDMIDYFIGVDLDTEDVYIIPICFSEKYKSSISLKTIPQYKNNFTLKELHARNSMNGEDNIGETLTGNTEGTE
jgi:hypothetical protein